MNIWKDISWIIFLIIIAKVVAIIILALTRQPMLDIIESNPEIGKAYPYTARLIDEFRNPILYALGNHFDSQHYLDIARYGYSEERLYAFPPIYPLLIRFFSTATGLGYILTGILISNIFSIVSVILFYRIALIYLDGKSSKIASLSFAFFPTNFAYGTVAYAEQIFLTLTLASWLFFAGKKYFWSGIFIMLSSLVRYPGVLLYVIMSGIYLLRNKEDAKIDKLIAMNISALVIICWFLVLHFNNTSPIEMQEKYGGNRLQYPLASIFFLVSLKHVYFPLIFFCFISFIVLGFFAKRISPELSLYSLLFVLFYGSTTGVPAESSMRYLGTVWPVYLYLSREVKRDLVVYLVLYLFYILSIVILLLHSSWIFIT